MTLSGVPRPTLDPVSTLSDNKYTDQEVRLLCKHVNFSVKGFFRLQGATNWLRMVLATCWLAENDSRASRRTIWRRCASLAKAPAEAFQSVGWAVEYLLSRYGLHFGGGGFQNFKISAIFSEWSERTTRRSRNGY